MTYAVLVLLLVAISYVVFTLYKRKQAALWNRMVTSKKSALRHGNEALDYLIDHYKPLDSKEELLVESLPIVGDLLYALSENVTSDLSSLGGKEADVDTMNRLSLSVFDLTLATYFNEVFDFLDHDKEVPSLLVDALLFQATGFEATSVAEQDMINDDTYRARGIQKFLLERQILSQSKSVQDAEGWLLGKEVACILSGGPDVSIVVAVSTPSLLLRYDARSIIRKILYNENPSKSERRKLETNFSKADKELLGKLNDVGRNAV
jgi:hypothetical protein